MEKIIEIKKLSFKYEEKEIIKNFNLDIMKGEFIGITGKNGSGKSTLMKILAGLEEIDNGEIFIEGEKKDSKSIIHTRNLISMVFQNPNDQIIGTKVIDDLVFGLENYGVKREEIKKKLDEIVNRFDLENILNRHPQELSGGQKQIVAIAGAMILEPKIIILDEITSMLDNMSKKKVYNEILKLKGEHTILMVTHDSRELLEVDRVILLDKGELKENTTPNKLFSNDELLNEYKLEKPFRFCLLEQLKKYGIKSIGDLDAN